MNKLYIRLVMLMKVILLNTIPNKASIPIIINEITLTARNVYLLPETGGLSLSFSSYLVSSKDCELAEASSV